MSDSFPGQNDNQNETSGSIRIENGRLKEYLGKVVPKVRKGLKTRKIFSIIIKYDRTDRHLTIADAIYNSASVSFEHECNWHDAVEVDGIWLKELLDSYKDHDILEILSCPDRIEIVKGRSRFKMPRL